MKKNEAYPARVSRTSAIEAMMRRMHAQNVLRRGELEGIKKGDLPPVLITVIKRQGKKKVALSRRLCWLSHHPAAPQNNLVQWGRQVF